MLQNCPMCQSNKIRKIENDRIKDLYYCDSCNHKFRYSEEVDNTIK